MGLRFADGHQCLMGKGIADEELLQQMHPLVLDLSACHGDRVFRAAGADLHRIEAVTASRRLPANLLQVGGDSRLGIGLVPEAEQLRVTPITPVSPRRTAWASSASRQRATSPARSRYRGCKLQRRITG